MKGKEKAIDKIRNAYLSTFREQGRPVKPFGPGRGFAVDTTSLNMGIPYVNFGKTWNELGRVQQRTSVNRLVMDC
jgi:hypothetical protein